MSQITHYLIILRLWRRSLSVSRSAPQVHCRFLPAIVPHLRGDCHNPQIISIFQSCNIIFQPCNIGRPFYQRGNKTISSCSLLLLFLSYTGYALEFLPLLFAPPIAIAGTTACKSIHSDNIGLLAINVVSLAIEVGEYPWHHPTFCCYASTIGWFTARLA
ncbi:hypothetical protein CRM81_16735 [Yersinia kristensenii]|nr:hypothetical protein CRM81_16735 [Yersinia kristensenii]